MVITEYTKEEQQLQQYLEKTPLAYQNGSLLIAYYAAYPRVFTPDMLYQLLANFNTYEIEETVHQIHYIAISDLLLSDLCTEISHDLFEMDEGIQRYLLTKPDEYFGKFNLPSKKDIAAFTYQYAIQFFNHPFKKNLKNVLYWKALATLASELMGSKIAAALDKFKDDKDSSI